MKDINGPIIVIILMPRRAALPDLHHASDTKIVLSVREKLLANN